VLFKKVRRVIAFFMAGEPSNRTGVKGKLKFTLPTVKRRASLSRKPTEARLVLRFAAGILWSFLREVHNLSAA
jgi:hypothetical protein